MTDHDHSPGLRLAIGTPLNIHVLSAADGVRLNARVLGMLEGASIIAHLLGAQGTLQTGDKVNVRCLEGVDIAGLHPSLFDGQHWEEFMASRGVAKEA